MQEGKEYNSAFAPVCCMTPNFESSLIINLCPAAEVISVKHSFDQAVLLCGKSQGLCSAAISRNPNSFPTPTLQSQCLASGSETTHSCSHSVGNTLTCLVLSTTLLYCGIFFDKETEDVVNGRTKAIYLPKQDLDTKPQLISKDSMNC